MNKEELALFRDLIEVQMKNQTDIIQCMDARLMKVEEALNRGKGAVAAFLTFISIFGIIVSAATRYFTK